MAAVELSKAARIDLYEIYDYSVEKFGPVIAGDYIADIDRALGQLGKFPHLGFLVPELKQSPRCLPCRQHRLYYRHEHGTVLIIRILHHAMDPRKWLG